MSRKGQQKATLFWLAIGLTLIFGSRQIKADPNRFIGIERSDIIITEFLVEQSDAGQSPESTLDTAAGGWLELHNRSHKAVNLANWTLTDDPDAPDKWIFPSTTIGGNDYLIIWTDNANLPESTEPRIEANIELNREGGFLALYPPTASRFADAASLSYPPQLPNTPFGRTDVKSRRPQYSYLANATPGQPNDSTVIGSGMTDPVIASVERGFFTTPFSVSLQTSTVDAEIRYTLDGREPSAEQGMPYIDEIPISGTTLLRAVAIKAGYFSGPVITHSYIFPQDVITQPQDPTKTTNLEWPETWGNHRITLYGHTYGDPVIADYEMDPQITQDPTYQSKMVESLLAIPSVSLVLDQENLDIYFLDPQMQGPASERPASVEFLYPNGERESVQSGTGLRIQGGTSRWEYMPKHSFRLFFKQQYGASKLEHIVFDDSQISRFNTLTLRGGSDRSFAGHPDTTDGIDNHRLTTYTRDEWARDTQIAMSGIGSHGTFVHLYLNGLYWGIYNVVERPDRVFAADYFGGDVEQWFTANHGGSGDGQIDRFAVMLQLAREGGLADPDKYATMLEFIDPIHFSDYMILNWAIGNRDWPENNWYANVEYPAGRNYFFVWDAENSWNNGADLRLGPDAREGAPFPNVAKLVFNALIENSEYRQLLADRLAKHLLNDGLLTDAPSQARWRAIAEPLTTAIIAESARWGDARYEDPITQADWLDANEQVLAQMEGNAEKLLRLAQDAGYYPPIAAPRFSQHGGSFDQQLSLEISTADEPIGQIYYTTDGSDPTGPNARLYEEAVVITTSMTVKSRHFVDGVWSALTEAHYQRSDQQSDIRITEIMYNPRGRAESRDSASNADLYEFIEIQNVGGDTADLSYAYFEGITYVFPAYTKLHAGEIMVLIKDFKSFRQRYPTAEFNGIYTGKLSNRGEAIALRDLNGQVLASVTYDDENGWPLSADGAGDSLVLHNLNGSPNNPQSWRASETIDGSPGE